MAVTLDLVVPASLTGPGINARLGVLAVGLVAFAAAVVDVTAVAIRFLDGSLPETSPPALRSAASPEEGCSCSTVKALAGVVRLGLEQSDLIFTQLGLSTNMDGSRGIAPNLYRRHLTIFLDGIRADRGRPSRRSPT